MRRSLALTSCVVAMALAPAALVAQTPAQPTPQTQPPSQPSATQPAPTQPADKAPKVGFTSPAGLLLVQIKPDQTATFEEMIGKLNAGLAKSDDPILKQQSSGFKVYKSAEPFGTNALYVITIEPSVKGAEYDLFAMLQKTMTREELAAPDTGEMWKRYANAFAAGLSRLSLTPLTSATPGQ